MAKTLLAKKNESVINSDKPMFPISIIADILNVHQRTLRIYDSENLLSPSRSAKRRRLYSLNDIERGKLIQYLTRSLGVNLSGIKIIFHLLSQVKDTNESQMDYIRKIAEKLDITTEMQEENSLKHLKRGRKKSVVTD